MATLVFLPVCVVSALFTTLLVSYVVAQVTDNARGTWLPLFCNVGGKPPAYYLFASGLAVTAGLAVAQMALLHMQFQLSPLVQQAAAVRGWTHT